MDTHEQLLKIAEVKKIVERVEELKAEKLRLMNAMLGTHFRTTIEYRTRNTHWEYLPSTVKIDPQEQNNKASDLFALFIDDLKRAYQARCNEIDATIEKLSSKITYEGTL